MVWNSTQSALYKAVDDYNSRVNSGEFYHNNYTEKMPEINLEKCTEKVPENCMKNSSNFDEKFGENFAEKSFEKCAEKCSKNSVNFEEKFGENNTKNCRENCTEKCPKFTENFCKNCPKNDTFSRLLSDKDFLLVAGLILVLLNEKADMKLILALVIVLLG